MSNLKFDTMKDKKFDCKGFEQEVINNLIERDALRQLIVQVLNVHTNKRNGWLKTR